MLAGHVALLGRLRHGIQHAVPASVQPLVAAVVNSGTEHRFGLGLAGTLIAIYCGWNWMNALRDALTGMWRLDRPGETLFATVTKDFLALIGLGLALLVIFAVTTAGSNLGLRLLGLARLTTGYVEAQIPVAGAILVNLAASWMIFWWVLAALPRVPVAPRAALGPALGTAIGFEVLKQLANLYLQALGRSPTGITLGSWIGLLVFAYLVSRLMLIAAAWIATGPPGPTPSPPRPSTSLSPVHDSPPTG
jgi:membrane protein